MKNEERFDPVESSMVAVIRAFSACGGSFRCYRRVKIGCIGGFTTSVGRFLPPHLHPWF
jgi:hypothetical protein